MWQLCEPWYHNSCAFSRAGHAHTSALSLLISCQCVLDKVCFRAMMSDHTGGFKFHTYWEDPSTKVLLRPFCLNSWWHQLSQDHWHHSKQFKKWMSAQLFYSVWSHQRHLRKKCDRSQNSSVRTWCGQITINICNFFSRFISKISMFTNYSVVSSSIRQLRQAPVPVIMTGPSASELLWSVNKHQHQRAEGLSILLWCSKDHWV